ncbi:MAG: Por secretion system C-terminal sorting protein [Actinomycetia bacterium]|nr:Por secretion system C-terminal sorting protein [Actinomycetes bacterium]
MRWLRAAAPLGVVASILLGAGCGGAAHAPRSAATTTSDPIVASLTHLALRQQAQIPGALPAGFHNAFAEAFSNWPVTPVHAQHPIRGSFLDPRGQDENGLAGYHFGIDVNVDDRRPEPGAGPGLSHRVYAVQGGRVIRVAGPPQPCANRKVEVGHFSYWHVSPVVTQWARIKPGQLIGWTCLGQWHVHVSEWRRVGSRRIWLNPLRPGIETAPYVDTEPPIVSAMRFFTPPTSPWHPNISLKGRDSATPLTPTRLHGRVELRAEIEDGQSFWGFMARHPDWETPHHPYRVGVEIRAHATRAVVMQRITFQSDEYPSTPYLVHYAPGTVQNGSMDECVHNPPTQPCAGTYWFRPFSRWRLEYWNTRTVRNGAYDVTVVAWDTKGNTGTLTVPVVVGNT